MMRNRLAVLGMVLAAGAMLAGAGRARADGLIVPTDPQVRVRGQWSVTYHHVDIAVHDQVADVSIDQEFVNTGRGMLEVEYIFPVPPEAAINAMTLVVDGKEYPARLLAADEARKTYEDIVRRKKDPALLEYAGYGLYRTRAFPLEAGKPAKVQVRYQVICRRDGDLVSVWYPLNTEKYSAKPIDSVKVRLDIAANQDIVSVYSPTHAIKEDRKGPRHVIVTYEEKDVLPADDLTVFYRLSDKDVGADLITWQPDGDTDGYFMLLVSPSPQVGGQAVTAKDVVLVLDHSGSMSGEKIVQARDCAQFVLDNLNDADRFSVIVYNDSVEALFDKLVPADKKHLDDARAQLARVQASGATNIHDALGQAMDIVSGSDRDGRPAYVIFLTDGLPTAGKTKQEDILADTLQANKAEARLFAFGVGYDVNVRLLDKLAQQNAGRSDYVKPNEPIEARISSLYAKIRNPVMTRLELDTGALRPRMMYPQDLGDLYEGDQIMVVGRYNASAGKMEFDSDDQASTTITISGQWQGQGRRFEYPVKINRPGTQKAYRFVESLWAMRRIGYLLDQVQLNGESKEIIDELVKLSTQYGIVTPYTSFLADESVALGAPAAVRERVARDVSALQAQTGGAGQMGAMNRQMYNQAKSAPAGNMMAQYLAMEGAEDEEAYAAGRVRRNVANVQRAGGQAMYRRRQVWQTADTADIDLERDKDRIRTIDRFSQEYFDLVGANSVVENQLMSRQGTDEQLLIRLRGQVYLIR